MNQPFDVGAGPSALPFDLNVHSTIISHLSNASDHLHSLSKSYTSLHPLSATQPPSQDAVLADVLTLTASIQNYQRSVTQLVQPMNGAEPMVLGAERFVSRLKEHASFLSRLELRKRAIRAAMEQIEDTNVKKGGRRRDLRFTQTRIEALIKQLGLLVYGNDTSTELPFNTGRFTFGGKLIVIDIDFQLPASSTPMLTAPSTSPASIKNISLSIAPADDERISSLGPPAAQILLSNIESGDGEQFVRNITNLARWDGCSSPTPNEGLNSFAVLRGVEDALNLIYQQERSWADEREVRCRGWGKPIWNSNSLIGMSVFYGDVEEFVLLGVEARRGRYVHPPLQTTYLAADDTFGPATADAEEDVGMFGEDVAGEGSKVLGGMIPNWLVMEGDMNLMPTCSFVMDLEPGVVMSVEGAKRVCEIVGYGGWNDVMNGVVKEEWVEQDTMLEDLLFDSKPSTSTVEVFLPNAKIAQNYTYIPVASIPARRVEKIPFSHPRQILPVLRTLRQWNKFNSLLKSCFPESSNPLSTSPMEPTLEDLLNGTGPAPSISVSPIPSSTSILAVFPIGQAQRTLRIDVLENGEIGLDLEDGLRERAALLIEHAGIGVGIEFLRKELEG